MSPAQRAAFQVLQRRAIQCSFSSVFHVARAGGSRGQAREFENVFLMGVGAPVALMGALGYVKWVMP